MSLATRGYCLLLYVPREQCCTIPHMGQITVCTVQYKTFLFNQCEVTDFYMYNYRYLYLWCVILTGKLLVTCTRCKYAMSNIIIALISLHF